MQCSCTLATCIIIALKSFCGCLFFLKFLQEMLIAGKTYYQIISDFRKGIYLLNEIIDRSVPIESLQMERHYS